MHFIDLVNFYSEQDIKMVDTDNLIRKVFSSKRSSYSEFFGEIKCDFSQGHSLTLNCSRGEGYSRTMSIENGDNHFVFDDLDGALYYSVNDFLIETLSYKLPFQSELTEEVFRKLNSYSECGLADFDLSSKQHRVFIRALLSFLSELDGETQTVCNIT
jgi:hypothetical protein